MPAVIFFEPCLLQFCVIKLIKMEALHHPLILVNDSKKTGIFTRFINWCNGQSNNRIAWLAIALAGHGCVLTPITIFFIMMSGNSFALWPIAMAAMAICLIVNLAALPSRITIPVFFASVLVDLVVIANCVAVGLHTV